MACTRTREARALAPYDVDRASRDADSLVDIACLAVVPSGQTRPLGDVLRELGLDAARLQPAEGAVADFVEFVRWRVSPSYDVVYMTGNSWAEEEGPPPSDPARPVYGVRLVAHSVRFCPWKVRDRVQE